jgi:hypothetical protein
MQARFACGSMVLFLLHKNLHKVQIFVKKDGFFRLLEAISPVKRGIV